MRKRLESGDVFAFEPHEILEYLLYAVVPYRNTNDIAHELIDRFGSLTNVLNAPKEELMKTPYISETGAMYLNSFPKLFRYYNRDKLKAQKKIQTFSDALDYGISLLENSWNEELYLICLDSKNAVIGSYLMAEGTVDSVDFPAREIVRKIISLNAAAAIIAHSHPGGIAKPSAADEKSTRMLCETLLSLRVTLLEHLIVVTETSYYSFFREGKLAEYRDGYYRKYDLTKVSQPEITFTDDFSSGVDAEF